MFVWEKEPKEKGKQVKERDIIRICQFKMNGIWKKKNCITNEYNTNSEQCKSNTRRIKNYSNKSDFQEEKPSVLFLNNDKLQLLQLIAPLLYRKTVYHIMSRRHKGLFFLYVCCIPYATAWKFSIGKSWQFAQSKIATGQFKRQVHRMKQWPSLIGLNVFFSRLQLNEFYLFLFIFGLII